MNKKEMNIENLKYGIELLRERGVFSLIAQFLIVRQRNKDSTVSSDNINFSEWIENTYSLYKKRTKVFKTLSFKMLFYKELRAVQNYLDNNENKSEAIEICKSKLLGIEEDKKFFVTKVIFNLGLLDEEIIEKIIEFAYETTNEDHCYWTAVDLSLATLLFQVGLNPKICNLRKKLNKKIIEDGKYQIQVKKRENSPNTLCIIVYNLVPTMRNSMFRCLKMIVDGIRGSFDEIYVLTADTKYMSRKDKAYYTSFDQFTFSYSKNHEKEIRKMLGQDTKIKLVSRGSYKERNQEFLNNLYEVNPSVILDLSDELSMTSYIYSKDYPTIYLPLRSNGYCSFYGHRLKKEKEKCDLEYDGEDKIIEWGFPQYVPSENGDFTRNDFGLKENSFVIASAAYVSAICNQQFCDAMASLLNTNPNFVWLIISDSAPLYMKKRYSDLFKNGQIIERSYESNLIALFKNCNVYLRTETTAGCGSTAIAAMASLPIVMMNKECDATRWLGDDYSGIDNYSDLFKEIERLYSDKIYYSKRSELCLSLVENAKVRKESWEKLAKILNEKL